MPTPNFTTLSPIAYFTLDRDGIVKEANLVGCSLLEIQRVQLIGLPLHSFVVDTDRFVFVDHLGCCRAGESQVSGELQVMSCAGRVIPVLLNSRVSAIGKHITVRSVMTDLTERRQGEWEIRNLNAHLEQRVRERTAAFERANQDLRSEIVQRQAAEAALQQASRLKDQFLAILGHELRNPLAPLQQAIDVWRMADSIAADELLQIQSIAERQVRHIAQLVDDLLDVSRISCGKIVLRKQPLDLTALIREVVKDFDVRYPSNDLEITIDLSTLPVWVEADPVRLSQVIGNLLHNANKFTPRGERWPFRSKSTSPCKSPMYRAR